MKKLATIAMAASVFMMPFAANASVKGTYEGIVTVHKGLTFDCKLTAKVVDAPSGHPHDYLTTLSLSMGNPLCTLISINSNPHDTDADSGDYTIHNINVTTITPGGCDGNAEGPYDANGLLVDVILAEDTPGTGNCSILGYLDKQ